MPGMSGLELQKYLTNSGSDIPIIFITAHDDSQPRHMALEANAIDFLKKPFEDQTLLDAIQRALNSYSSPQGCQAYCSLICIMAEGNTISGFKTPSNPPTCGIAALSRGLKCSYARMCGGLRFFVGSRVAEHFELKRSDAKSR